MSDFIASSGYAVSSPTSPIAPFSFKRRALRPRDVLIEIEFCGVCHSDIHECRNDWHCSVYPMVPGHEIVGIVKAIGSEVTKFKVGQRAGVGCMVGSCMKCEHCLAGEEQYCDVQTVMTYNSPELGSPTPTYGGYADNIVVDEHFALRIPENLDPASAAPLLCAGITTYSPLRHWGVGPGYQVAIVGMGGLGHVGIKIANTLGAEVTVLSTSNSKAADAARMGAKHFIDTTNPLALPALRYKFDIVISTIPVTMFVDQYLETLKVDGTLILLGMPGSQFTFNPFSVQMKRRSISGSFMGGIQDTQDMLDFCGEHNITADIQLISPNEINQAWRDVIDKKARYRYVIDMRKQQ